jgi:hypothetical protein
MTLVNLTAVAIIIGIAFLESKRGFGYSLFDLIGGIIAVKLALFAAPVLAETSALGMAPDDAKAFWLATVFVVLGVLALLASRLIYQNTLLSIDVLDPTIGAIFGIGCGIILAHVLLQTMLWASSGSPLNARLADTAAVTQLVDFRGLKAVLDMASHVGELPPPGSQPEH